MVFVKNNLQRLVILFIHNGFLNFFDFYEETVPFQASPFQTQNSDEKGVFTKHTKNWTGSKSSNVISATAKFF